MKNKSTSLQLFLDIGNTSVTFGFYQGRKLKQRGSRKYTDIPKMAKKWSKSGKHSSFDVIISSVVPKRSIYIRKHLKGIASIKVHIVGKNLLIPIKHRYKPKNKLGIDRLVNIYGVQKFYKEPCLVLDFGTALTADYVSKDGSFKGGMIIPGPEISFQALLERAAGIPNHLRLPNKTKDFLGNSTYECIRSGIMQGYGSMVDELIARFRKKYSKNLRVIATGGFTEHLKPFIRTKVTYTPYLSIRGLHTLFLERTRGC